MDIWIPVVIVGVVGIVIVGGIVAHRKRMRELQETLAGAGFTPMFNLDPLTRAQAFSHVGAMQVLRTGDRGVRWAARGVIDEREVWILEHSYTTGSGKNRTTHYNTIISTPAPHAWPDLSLTTENIFHKIGELFGGKDIRVESEAFNKRWRVKCDNEDFAIVVLSPPVQEWMMGLEKNLWVRIGQGAVCIGRSSTIKAGDLQSLAPRPVALIKMLPPELAEWGA